MNKVTTTDNNEATDNQEFISGVIQAASDNPDYDPILQEAPKVQDYQKPMVDVSKLPEEIPEALFIPDTTDFGFGANPEALDTAENPSELNQKVQSPTFNPKMNDLSKSEKRIAAEMAADTAIDAYGMLWQKVLTPFAQFNEKKMQKEYVAGTINPQLGIPMDANTTLPVKDYTKNFNAGVELALKVTDQFKENVREPLVRVLEKRGLGLTDEQKIGWEVLQDFWVKTAMVISIRNDIKEVLEHLRDDSKKIVNHATPVPPSAQTAENKEQTADFDADPTGNISADLESQSKNEPQKEHKPSEIGVVRTPILPFASADVLKDMEEEAKRSTITPAKSNPTKRAQPSPAKTKAASKPKRTPNTVKPNVKK